MLSISLNGATKPMNGLNLKNLKAMPVDDLLTLREEISRVLASRVQSERRELEARLAKLQSVRLSESNRPSTHIRSNSKKSGKLPALYRNTEHPFETWAGRGRQPLWMTAAIKAGKKRSDFLIGSELSTNSARKHRTRRRSKTK